MNGKSIVAKKRGRRRIREALRDSDTYKAYLICAEPTETRVFQSALLSFD
ncbi:MAG: hypothetical protein IKY04_06675 [Lachnospiraceae bacterium]|nr:hypothetical protein [Lachnospiraceae bacterium]